MGKKESAPVAQYGQSKGFLNLMPLCLISLFPRGKVAKRHLRIAHNNERKKDSFWTQVKS